MTSKSNYQDFINMSSSDFEAIILAVSRSQTLDKSAQISAHDIEELKYNPEFRQRFIQMVEEMGSVISAKESGLHELKKAVAKKPGIKSLNDLIRFLEDLISYVNASFTGDMVTLENAQRGNAQNMVSDGELEVAELNKFHQAIQEATQYGAIIAKCQEVIVKRIQNFSPLGLV